MGIEWVRATPGSCCSDLVVLGSKASLNKAGLIAAESYETTDIGYTKLLERVSLSRDDMQLLSRSRSIWPLCGRHMAYGAAIHPMVEPVYRVLCLCTSNEVAIRHDQSPPSSSCFLSETFLVQA